MRLLQAIHRLAATHSVQAMVWNSPAGRFLDHQVSNQAACLSQDLNLVELFTVVVQSCSASLFRLELASAL